MKLLVLGSDLLRYAVNLSIAPLSKLLTLVLANAGVVRDRPGALSPSTTTPPWRRGRCSGAGLCGAVAI